MKLTETKRVRFDRSCVDNPVYLRWLNSLNGWNYWLFSRNQFVGVATGMEVVFENPVTNLETAESFEEVLSVEAEKTMELGREGLDRNDIEYVKSILYSAKVQWLFNGETWQADGECKWVTVRPKRGTFPLLETKEERADIFLSISFPRINTQNQ